jgi:hypothetical protein
METREQIVSKLMAESEKLQYDKDDPQRIYDASEKATQSFVSLLGLIAEFRDEIQKPVDEDSADTMKQIRQDLVTMYADTLVNLHKIGAVFRISGEAFDRTVEYLSGPEEAPLVMAGL